VGSCLEDTRLLTSICQFRFELIDCNQSLGRRGFLFLVWINTLKHIVWVVYAKEPFAGPKAVLAYLSRYTHRVAIVNCLLVAADAKTVSFCWKDYRLKGTQRNKVMSLATGQFI